MLVELSVDYGQTWKLLRYFAQDCATSFPDIPSRPAREVGEVVCDSRYSDIEPSTEGEVVFKALDPNFEIQNPYAPDIQALITFTNLRINFTKLHTLGDILLGQKQPDPLEKYYYALYEMVVRGSCFCNGHASYCSPVQNLRGDIFHEPEMSVNAMAIPKDVTLIWPYIFPTIELVGVYVMAVSIIQWGSTVIAACSSFTTILRKQFQTLMLVSLVTVTQKVHGTVDSVRVKQI
uniref:Laminin subunit beta-4 n=1 Tax=Sphaerodactylus townsendi TaxID=933632 RepID=A0ACB8FQ72_9SAUR